MTLKPSKKLIMTDSLGWKIHEFDTNTFWFKGYLLNTEIKDLYEKLKVILTMKNFNIDSFSDLLRNLKGHFAFVIEFDEYVLACVDRVCSVPLFYIDTANEKKISNNAESLAEYENLDFEILDNKSALEVAMSGYTIGNKTLYRDMNQLIAGQLILLRKEKIEKFSYYIYNPTNIVNNSKKILKDKLTQTLEETFEDFTKNIDGRQLVVPLSAGIDSRLIASGLKYLGIKNVFCFAYGVENNYETKTSEYVANKLGFTWRHVPISRATQKSFFLSQEFKDFCSQTETFGSIPFIQDVSAIKWLKKNGVISNNAIIVNGNTGDFISGGHIPKSLKKQNFESIGQELLLNNSWDDFLNKHFSLWGHLRTSENDNYIKKSLSNYLSEIHINMPTDMEKLHGIFESLEFYGRQSKYIVNMQRSYEFSNYSWRMPLWSNQMLDFWETVPRKYKINQNLYKRALKENNWGGVWHDIPINSGEINSNFLRAFRFFFKAIYSPFGVKAWHKFERNAFQYFLDTTQNSSIVPYRKVLFDRRGQRHSVSWLAEMYLNKKGFNKISKNFPS